MITDNWITAQQAIDLEKTGHVVHIMPRKMMIRVDGFKLYKANTCTIETIKYWRKTGFICKH